MNKVLLWLDDLRNPFEYNWVNIYIPKKYFPIDDIIWVKSYEDFINYININGLPYIISFDHDLGENEAKEKVFEGMSKKQARQEKKLAKTGYDCAHWLVEYCLDKNISLPYWIIHSANPVGKENIDKLLKNYAQMDNVNWHSYQV